MCEKPITIRDLTKNIFKLSLFNVGSLQNFNALFWLNVTCETNTFALAHLPLRRNGSHDLGCFRLSLGFDTLSRVV